MKLIIPVMLLRPVLAAGVVVGTPEALMTLLWGGLAIIAAFMSAWAAVVMWKAFTMDRSSGEWKNGLMNGIGIVAVPAIVALLVAMFWGVPAPALNWAAAAGG